MYKFSKDELILLASLESIDSISVASFRDEVTLHRGKHVGMYVSGHGVVLEPIYSEVSRCSDLLKDLICVGIRKKGFLFYGTYSICKKEFVLPLIYTNYEFWKHFKAYLAIHHPTPPFRRIWG